MEKIYDRKFFRGASPCGESRLFGEGEMNRSGFLRPHESAIDSYLNTHVSLDFRFIIYFAVKSLRKKQYVI